MEMLQQSAVAHVERHLNTALSLATAGVTRTPSTLHVLHAAAVCLGEPGIIDAVGRRNRGSANSKNAKTDAARLERYRQTMDLARGSMPVEKPKGHPVLGTSFMSLCSGTRCTSCPDDAKAASRTRFLRPGRKDPKTKVQRETWVLKAAVAPPFCASAEHGPSATDDSLQDYLVKRRPFGYVKCLCADGGVCIVPSTMLCCYTLPAGEKCKEVCHVAHGWPLNKDHLAHGDFVMDVLERGNKTGHCPTKKEVQTYAEAEKKNSHRVNGIKNIPCDDDIAAALVGLAAHNVIVAHGADASEARHGLLSTAQETIVAIDPILWRNEPKYDDASPAAFSEQRHYLTRSCAARHGIPLCKDVLPDDVTTPGCHCECPHYPDVVGEPLPPPVLPDDAAAPPTVRRRELRAERKIALEVVDAPEPVTVRMVVDGDNASERTQRKRARAVKGLLDKGILREVELIQFAVKGVRTEAVGNNNETRSVVFFAEGTRVATPRVGGRARFGDGMESDVLAFDPVALSVVVDGELPRVTWMSLECDAPPRREGSLSRDEFVLASTVMLGGPAADAEDDVHNARSYVSPLVSSPWQVRDEDDGVVCNGLAHPRAWSEVAPLEFNRPRCARAPAPVQNFKVEEEDVAAMPKLKANVEKEYDLSDFTLNAW